MLGWHVVVIGTYRASTPRWDRLVVAERKSIAHGARWRDTQRRLHTRRRMRLRTVC